MGNPYISPIYPYLVGAQPPPCCSFARHLVGKMVIHCSFAHHEAQPSYIVGVYGLLSPRIPIFSPYKYHGYTVRGTPVLVP